MLTRPPSCFAFYSLHLSPRVVIVFSLVSSVPNFSMSHSSIFLISNTSFLLVYFTFSHCVNPTLYCFTTRGTSVHLLPLLDYWYLFLLSGRSGSPKRNRSFSVFA